MDSEVFFILEAFNINSFKISNQFKYIQNYYGFDDAYFYYRDTKIYVSSLENQINFFQTKEAWYEIGQRFVVLCFVKIKPKINQYFLRQENLYQTEVFYVPFTWHTSEIIYHEGAGLSLGIDNNYYNVFSVGYTVISFIRERDDYLIFGGGDSVIMENGETKKSRDGKSYMNERLDIVFPRNRNKYLVYMLPSADTEEPMLGNTDTSYSSTEYLSKTRKIGQNIIDFYVGGSGVFFNNNSFQIEYIQALQNVYCGNKIKYKANLTDTILNSSFKYNLCNVGLPNVVYGSVFSYAELVIKNKLPSVSLVVVNALSGLQSDEFPVIENHFVGPGHSFDRLSMVRPSYPISTVNKNTRVWTYAGLVSDSFFPMAKVKGFVFFEVKLPVDRSKHISIPGNGFYGESRYQAAGLYAYEQKDNTLLELISPTILPFAVIPYDQSKILLVGVRNYNNLDLTYDDQVEISYFKEEYLESNEWWILDKTEKYSYGYMATEIIEFDINNKLTSNYEMGSSKELFVYALEYKRIDGEYKYVRNATSLSSISSPYYQVYVSSISLDFKNQESMSWFNQQLVISNEKSIESNIIGFFNAIPNNNSLNINDQAQEPEIFHYTKKTNDGSNARSQISYYSLKEYEQIGDVSIDIDLSTQEALLKNTLEQNKYTGEVILYQPNSELSKGIRTFKTSFNYDDYFYGLGEDIVVNQFIFENIKWEKLDNFSYGSQQIGTTNIYRSETRYILPKNLPKYKRCSAVVFNEATNNQFMLDPRLLLCDIFRTFRSTLLPLYIKNQDQDYFVWQSCEEFQSNQFYLYCDKPISFVIFLLSQ